MTSPLERCRETARLIARRRARRRRADVDRRGVSECDYGDWPGRALKELAKEPLWKAVQSHPSAADFPGGESMRGMQDRAVAAVRRRDAAVEAEHGADAVWLAVSHGDVIKAVLADALGMHLDLFQRIHVDPASVIDRPYTALRPFVLGTNTHGGDLLLTPRRSAAAASGGGRRDAAVGGGAGPAAPGQGDLGWRHARSSTSSTRPSASWPGTVGEPGQRTFFLQARERRPHVSVALEKQQVAALAERIDELLDEVVRSRRRRRLVPAVAPLDLDDTEPLEQPIEEEFRAGTMTLAWDADDERVVIEVFPFTEATRSSSPEQVERGPRGRRSPTSAAGAARRRRPRGLRQAGRSRSSAPAGRPARSAAARSTPTATCACGPTATARREPERPWPSTDADLLRPASSTSTAAVMPRPTRTFVGEHRRRRACVYKPVAGERPLWDFPDGTLAGREVAAYAVSEATRAGTSCRRPSCATDRTAPAWCQLWMRARRRRRRRSTSSPSGAGARRAGGTSSTRRTATTSRSSLVHEDTDRLRRMAVFDVVVNNADRKGGHVLADARRPPLRRRPRRPFHIEHKLRTVLWGWAGEPLTDEEIAGLERLRDGARRRPRGEPRASC